jgi:hypothetical protein
VAWVLIFAFFLQVASEMSVVSARRGAKRIIAIPTTHFTMGLYGRPDGLFNLFHFKQDRKIGYSSQLHPSTEKRRVQ